VQVTLRHAIIRPVQRQRQRRAHVLVLFAAAVCLSPLLLACNVSCKAQDINGPNASCGGGAHGFMWTGTSCIYTVACNCTGRDCQRLYATQDSCETAHIHCR
jgi:hypothetical protein